MRSEVFYQKESVIATLGAPRKPFLYVTEALYCLGLMKLLPPLQVDTDFAKPLLCLPVTMLHPCTALLVPP
jgi:hypothetical protein